MVNMLIKGFTGVIQWLATTSIDFVLTIFQYLGLVGRVVLDMPVVTTGILFTQTVALSFLSVKVAYEGLMTYILRQSGEVNGDPSNLVIGTARAAGVIAVMPWLVRYMFEFGVTFQNDVIALDTVGQVTATNSTTFSLITNMLSNAGNYLFLYAIAALVGVVLLVIVMVQSFVRAADLIVEAWTGSFAALGLTNSQSQTWNKWFWNTLWISLTAAVQLGLIKLSFNALKPINVTVAGSDVPLPPIVNTLLFIAVLFVAYRSPQTLKEKMNVTGVGKIGGAVSQMGIQSILMRARR
ncbi:conjugal transfer protein TrbL family protein [Paenibacillus sp. FSL L8-0463]|uniref:conjugal transfer protein TrbL family protein n=1 Tax=Paenibacillus sp. FSL L8-0463 TaxID=2954687 RepID=UPI00311A38BA